MRFRRSGSRSRMHCCASFRSPQSQVPKFQIGFISKVVSFNIQQAGKVCMTCRSGGWAEQGASPSVADEADGLCHSCPSLVQTQGEISRCRKGMSCKVALRFHVSWLLYLHCVAGLLQEELLTSLSHLTARTHLLIGFSRMSEWLIEPCVVLTVGCD